MKRKVFSYNNNSYFGEKKQNNNNSLLNKLRKLQIDSKYVIVAKVKGNKGESVKFIQYIIPDDVYINDSLNSKGAINSIILDEDGPITITMVWNSSRPTFLYGIFGYCANLISVDLSNFNTDGVTTFSHMFMGCYSLEYVNFENVNMSSATEIDGLFQNCSSLKRVDLSNIDASQVTHIGLAFGGCPNLTSVDLSYFYAPKMDRFAVNPIYIVFDSCDSLFINMSHFNAETTTNFNALFYNCKNSLSIDLSYSNFPNINNMDSYFKNYNNLKYINLSHMKTSVSNMNNMFSGCSSLELIDLSGFETSSLIEMSSIFDGCSSLESIDLSKFDISNVKDISYMFYNCISLKSINLDNFNALNIENMNYMFSGCESFISLNLSQFYSLSLKHMNSMFSNCISLMILDLSNFKANNINTFSSAFDNCPSLKYINLYNYEGGDIFNSLSYKEKNFIYCMETNEIKNDESFSLYNYINNCSDTCFNSPIIINETEKKCYINCIELEENYFCNYEHSEIINTVPDYFYLDINEKALKKCYSTCKNCFTNGDENDNNCSACIENYKFMEESLNKNNCFEECPYNYFDTLNSFHCIKNISLNDILNDMSSLIIFRDYYEPYYINGEKYSN